MKVFFDTEFTGLHKNTTLISIGLVAGDGKTFYAEFSDYDRSQVDDWIKENVLAHLKFNDDPSKGTFGNLHDGNIEMYGTKADIGASLRGWLSKYDNVQLVSDVCHYDMVLFIDLFGSAFDLPKQVCPACHDINQDIAEYWGKTEMWAFDMSREKIAPPIQGEKHNSLYDAKVIKAIYNYVHQ